MRSSPGAIHQVADALAARGYRWQPPPPLGEAGGSGPFAHYGAASWIDPLLPPLSHSRGGVHTVRWSIRTHRLHGVPTAMPPSAQRVLSAVWAGPRPPQVPVGDVTGALAHAGLDPRRLACVVSARPPDGNAVHEALTAHPVTAAGQVSIDTCAGAALRRTVLAVRAHVSIEYPVGAPCSGTCRPGCRCGRYLVLARLQFGETSRGRSLLEAVVLENGLLGALGDTREPFAVRRFAPLVRSAHESLPDQVAAAAGAEHVRLLVDRCFTAALLLGQGVVPGARGRAHVVRRLLRQAGVRLFLAGGSLTRLDHLVGVADGSVRAELGFAPLTVVLSDTVRTEREGLARVLARAPVLLHRAVAGHREPAARADAVLRLRNEHGVPLDLAMTWCRENGISVSLRDVARLERSARGPARRGVRPEG
ncbi:alanine--tRNA ligase-related protein [Streptomyces sp. NBC_00654]|uniref:alanine--tRNA ligase-related protein n=1 Tax=Streptomyces sp. NBC_00654 TaxID=2975799 RepID=UPI0022503DA8|nr:alanine--tRNA ligase-related protein [Streptomyces sp. NBC_00654]MCX4970680.1 alanine--tRNA ligase-related protein [Streptomyces sp. NBC_00654]